MKNIGKIALCALGLVAIHSSARAEESKQPKPLSRKEMKEVRGSGFMDGVDPSRLGTHNFQLQEQEQAQQFGMVVDERRSPWQKI